MDDTPRPASILSPYGEGYCRFCRFVVGLNEYGLLDGHRRGLSMEGRYAETSNAPLCKGSDRAPAKVTPYQSKKSAFRMNVAMGECRTCGRRVRLDPRAPEVLGYHDVTSYMRQVCPGSRTTPVRR